MAAAETARLIASLELQDKNFTRGIRNVERGVNRVDKKLGAFSGFVNRNMARAIDSIGVHLVSAVGTGLEELATLEDATTSVNGAIAQVGKGWSTTGEEIAKWANEIESATDAAFDDKAITQVATTLIRYGNVSEQNLRPALEVVTDLAAKTGDLDSAGTKLAKALADPTKATRILRDAGVRLTKAEDKRLKQLVKANKLGEAQALVLKLVGERTKNAAKDSAGPYRDALRKLADAGEDLRRSFAVGLLPVIEEVSTLLTTELAKPETLNALKGIGSALADTLRAVIDAAKRLPWKEIGTSLQIAGTAAKTILDAFLGLPPWIQAAVVTGWGLNKVTGGLIGDLASGLIKGVLGMNAGVVHLKAATVVGGPGGAGGAPVPGGKGGGLFGGLGKLAFGLTSVGLTALFAEFIHEDITGPLAKQLQKDVLGGPLINVELNDLQWPFGPKNTPTILPDIFGGNGLLGGTPGTPKVTGGDRPSPGNPGLVKPKEIGDAAGASVSAKLLPTIKTITNAVQLVRGTVATQGRETKSAIATMDQNQRANALAVIASQAAGQLLATFQAATQAIKTAGTTTAVNNTKAAVGGVAPAITPAVYAIGSQITSAIWAARPVIQSTNVVNNYTRTERYGATGDSRMRAGGPTG